VRSRHLLWPLVLCGALTACAGASARPQPSPSIVASTQLTADAVGACARPTTTTTTGQRIGIGSPIAPTIGPLSFHPYPYQPGFITKMLIHPVRDQPQTIVLTGQRCSDGRPLRFWYGRTYLPPPPPLSEEQLQSLGDLAQSLPPTPANVDHGGYVLFSGPGRWEITVSQGDTNLGVLLVTVVQQ
jgi:hypothetical protein